MRTIILAGGLGTRLSEETVIKPKPMVEIGGVPIIAHIMKWYSKFGVSDFSIALGYKGSVIKDYFLNLEAQKADIEIDIAGRTHSIIRSNEELPNWRIRAIETGLATQTGGRIKSVINQSTEDIFFCTYGDGLSDVPIDKLLEFHHSHGKIATVTAVRPPARFGQIRITGDSVSSFGEKVQTEEGWINGGYFVFNREIVNYISGAEIIFEREPLEALAAAGELMAYRHDGFWHPMDTLREKELLESLWSSGQAPWSVES